MLLSAKASGLLALFTAMSLWFCAPLFLVRIWGGTGQLIRPQMHDLIFDSHEKLTFIIRLSEFYDAWGQGQWPVRWCGNLCGGYGYPFFSFYAPLSYYLASGWHALSLNLFTAWKMHFLLMAILSAAGSYQLARVFCGRYASLLAAALYLYAPYHIANLYVRGNVAEFTAMSLFPFVLLTFYRLGQNSTSAWRLVAASLLLAALIVTHNITALFGSAIAACFGLCAVRSKRDGATICGALIIGFMISAWFWIPAILEMRTVNPVNLAETFNGAADHCAYWHQYFQNLWNFGLSVAGPGDQMPFSLGLPQWIGLGLALAATTMPSVNRRPALALLVAVGALLLLMSTWCAFLWKLPGFRIIQFPWRLLTFASLFAALAGGCGLESLFRLRLVSPTARNLVMAAGMVGIAVWAGPRLSVQGYFPNVAEMYRPAHTRQQFITTNNNEFLFKWIDRDLWGAVSPRRILTSDGARVRYLLSYELYDSEFSFQGVGGDKLTVEMFYTPDWKVSLAGNPVAVRASSIGLIEFDAAPGMQKYQLTLGYSIVRQWATAVAAAGVLLLMGTCIYSSRRRRQLIGRL